MPAKSLHLFTLHFASLINVRRICPATHRHVLQPSPGVTSERLAPAIVLTTQARKPLALYFVWLFCQSIATPLAQTWVRKVALSAHFLKWMVSHLLFSLANDPSVLSVPALWCGVIEVTENSLVLSPVARQKLTPRDTHPKYFYGYEV